MYPSTSASYATPPHGGSAYQSTSGMHNYPPSVSSQAAYTIPKSPSNASMINGMARYSSNNSGGSVSPAQMSLRSGASFMIGGAMPGAGAASIGDSASLIFAGADEDALLAQQPQPTSINLQIFIPEMRLQKCLNVNLDELVWDIKQKVFDSISQKFPEYYNYGLFLPPCDGRAGKFLLDDRPIREYPFHDCAPYVEMKYKTRVYKALQLDDKAVRNANTRSSQKKFMEHVHSRNIEKLEKMCRQGLDPNFHDSQGYTPLTLAAEIPNNRDVLVQLVGGGAHLDFRSSEGQTALHRAAFLSLKENVKTLLELGASPNYRDLIGLTPLYYNMLTTDSDPQLAEILLSEGADVLVYDMHANDPLHQACKNGLTKHAEHLLFYGSNINAQNVNGNTPLHVCAVNNRVDCARMLLYRGADRGILNKHGQTAEHVAYIVNNAAVADTIHSHAPDHVVPFRGTPKYNTRRRMTNAQIQRRRSLSHSSMSSMQSTNDSYQALTLLRPQPIVPKCVSSMDTTCNYDTLKKYPPEVIQASRMAACVEVNVPRTIVIPRGSKGFGFILRGANQLDPNAPPFEPSPLVPALQFFEGVETSGMAMKVGLRPGDFLLRIGDVDVRCASHEEVVELINQAEDSITLTVITIHPGPVIGPPTAAANSSNYHYIPPTIAARRNQSVPRNSMYGGGGGGGTLPPVPPQRNPANTISYGRVTGVPSTISAANGYALAIGLDPSSDYGNYHPVLHNNGYVPPQIYATPVSIYRPCSHSKDEDRNSNNNGTLKHHPDINNNNNKNGNNNNDCSVGDALATAPRADSPPSSLASGSDASGGRRASLHSNLSAQCENGVYLTGAGVNEHYASGSSGGPGTTTASPGCPQQQTPQLRCASVKGRPSPSRRISAAELEHLMIRQTTAGGPQTPTDHGPSQFQPSQSAFLSYNQDSLRSNNGGGPKKFTSIAEMKRRKEQGGGVTNPLLQRANSSGGSSGAGVVRQSAYEDADDISVCSAAPPFRTSGGELKSFNSTPDLAGAGGDSVNFRDSGDASEYARRHVLRPKTPPPPPPPQSGRATPRTASDLPPASTSSPALPSQAGPSVRPNTAGSSARQSAATPAGRAPAPPPAPPPPPPNFLKSFPPPKPKTADSIPKPSESPATPAAAQKSAATADCRGISAEALQSVKLKKVGTSSPATPGTGSGAGTASPAAERRAGPANFDMDLRSALARRRSKVCADDDDTAETGKFREGGTTVTPEEASRGGGAANRPAAAVDAKVTLAGTVAGRYGGLSLRESVHENVQAPVKSGGKAHASHHSPTGVLSFASKKDSGYTSSRTSLEPSECGDEPQARPPAGAPASSAASTTTPTLAHSSASSSSNTLVEGDGVTRVDVVGPSASGHHVTLISQQLEDDFGAPLPRLSQKSTPDGAPVGVEPAMQRPLFLENPAHTPPADYDNDCKMAAKSASPDSGKSSTADFSNPPTPDPDGFRVKPLAEWSAGDVGYWLKHLQLADHYAGAFAARAINGARLAGFDRAQFTQLGVTRIAHRQAMEQSLREFSNAGGR